MLLFTLGTFLLVVALVAALIAATSYGMLIYGQRAALVWGRAGVWTALGAMLLAALLLVMLFLLGRYEFDYVFNYSSIDLETRYKLSALWAGQQGSFMVWSLVGLAAAPLLIRRSRAFEPFVLLPLMFTQVVIIGLMFIRNPFALRLNTGGEIIYAADGRGLNELLHNPWMVIHPPVLFLGYGLLAIPFAYAIAGLWRRDYDGWARAALPWTITAWVVLSTALTLGGYWAYETLGWGGYWAWDPVENASLLPWLTSSALIHGLLVQRAHGGLRRTNLLLALGTYVLVFYASFLTRSGVLSEFSVHSFTEEGLERAMASALVVGLAVSSWMLVRRWREIPVHQLSTRLLSRDSLFVLGMLSFVIVMVIVALGTSMPLISRVPALRDGLREFFSRAFDIDASSDGRFSLRPLFFSKTTPPLGLVIIGLTTIAPLLGWRGGNIRLFVRALRLPAVGAVAATVAAVLLGVQTPLNLAYIGFGAFALGTNLTMIIRTLRSGWMRIGGYVAHIGAALLVIGFVGSSAYSTPEERLSIPVGETQQVYGYNVTFDGYATRVTSQGAEKGVLALSVQPVDSTEIVQAEPQLYLNPRDQQWIRTPAILRHWWGDVYFSPGEYLGPSDPNQTILGEGQSGTIGPYRFTFQGFDYSLPETEAVSELTLGARVTLYAPDGTTTTLTPKIFLEANQEVQALPVALPDGNALLLDKASLESGLIMLRVAGLDLPVVPERADIFVSTKPAVSLVWLGTLVMTLGGSLAATRRFIEHAHKRRTTQHVGQGAVAQTP